MKKQAKVLLSVSFVAVIIFCVLFCAFFVDNKKLSPFNLVAHETQTLLKYTNKIDQEYSVSLTSEEKVDIVTTEGSDYVIIFSSDSRPTDQTLARDLSNAISGGCGVNVRYMPDVAGAEEEYEILLGDTNRAFSAELFEAINAYGSADEFLIWGYAYKNGKLAYTANSDVAFSYGSKEFSALLSANGTISVPSNLFVINCISVRDYEEQLRIEEEQKKQEYLASVIEKNNAFTDAQFNTDKYTPGQFYKPIIDENGNGYFTTKGSAPWAYPTAGQHPRYLLTSNNIPKIKAMLEDGKNKDSVYYAMAEEFWRLANSDETVHRWGIFPEKVGKSGEIYRYDEQMLAAIDAKAMAYLLTGDEIYAYEALVCIKNAMLTLHYTKDLHMDVFHGPSHVMVVLAAVYDWCYDMLTENDKWQLIWGTAQILGPQMEEDMRYPPHGMNGVNGHGTGPQLPRDWMSVATVFYDEAPDWYEYIAGRYFNEFIPVANAQFQNGWVSQGTTTYGPIKIHVQAWANYLIKTSTGENFLTEDAVKTMYYFISHITPLKTDNVYQQYYFQTGDGIRYTEGADVGFAEYFVIAALYNDPVIYAQALKTSNNHSRFAYDSIFTMTPSFQLAFASAVDYNGESARDGVDTIQYFAYPAGHMTIREEWENPDSVAIMMRLTNLTMANHQGYDHGTFQIYYKGLLATTSGFYKKYEAEHHLYYLQSTIAHNGLLVFNPAMADAEPVYNTGTLTNAERYYYSGSQRLASVKDDSVDDWLSSAAMVETLGAAYGYNSDGTAKYAYIAGDMTDAYDDKTVDFIGRRMFTLFTGDEDFPALFFTFDQITSIDESFTKHWLLHTIQEPKIDQDNLTATVINGDGKMYVESLFGAKSIVKIGGEGRAFWINGYFTDPTNKGSWDEKLQDFTDPENKGSWVEGKNATDKYAPDDQADSIWGRIELRTSGEKYSKLLTVMAITDTVNETPFEITKFKNDTDTVYGAQFKNNIVIFLNSENNPSGKQSKEFSFTTEGRGLLDYYISGIDAGTWTVKVDGVTVAHAYTTKESGFIDFVAPSGLVTLEPGKDVRPADSDDIKYITYGGILPDDTQYYYLHDVEFMLPLIPSTDTVEFVGWSYTEDSSEVITSLPVGTRGTVKLYARYNRKFIQDYENISINNDETKTNANVGGLTYVSINKSSALFKTEKSEDNTYLLWKHGTKDPDIRMNGALADYVSIDGFVTFSLDVALADDSATINSQFQLRGYPTDVTKLEPYRTNIFTFKLDNSVLLGGLITPIANLTTEFTRLTATIDFNNGMLYAFDKDGNFLAKTELPLSKESKEYSLQEYVNLCSKVVFCWYSYHNEAGQGALKIDNLTVTAGLPVGALLPDESAPNAIVYRNAGVLPAGSLHYYNADKPTPLPIPNSTDGMEFYGWYSDPDFETPVYEVPAGQVGPYTVYARWKTEWCEDFSGSTVDAYTNADGTEFKNDSENGISYYANKNFDTVIKTVDDGAGGKYLYWSSKKYANMQVAGKLTNFIGGDTCATFRIKLAIDGDTSPSQILVRLQGASSPNFEFVLFQTNAQGKILLNNKSNLVIGTLSSEFTEIIVTVDFFNATLTAYNPDGSVVITESGVPAVITDLAVPKNATSDNFLNLKNEIMTGFVFMNAYAETQKKTALLVDDLMICSGQYGMKKFTADANDIIYEGVDSGKLPKDAPKNYDRNNGTVLPQNVDSGNELKTFDGWYLDKEFTKPISEISAGTLGIVTVYAKWLLYSDAPNAIIYNGIELNELPSGTHFYHSPDNSTPLPVIPDISDKCIFGGWYEDENYTKRIYEVPAGLTSPYTVYIRWIKIWKEDFSNSTVDAYTNADGTEFKNDSENGISYYANKNFDTVIKTVDDGAGGKYLYWSSKKYANMQVAGKLTNFIGGDTCATFRIKLAIDGDTSPSQILVRLQGASSPNFEFVLFQTNAQGKILLNNKSNLVIGTLSSEFTEIIVTVDFFNATLTAYNPDGSVVITESGVPAVITDLAVPKNATSDNFLNLKNEIMTGFVFMNAYAETQKKTALLVDDLMICSGSYSKE